MSSVFIYCISSAVCIMGVTCMAAMWDAKQSFYFSKFHPLFRSFRFLCSVLEMFASKTFAATWGWMHWYLRFIVLIHFFWKSTFFSFLKLCPKIFHWNYSLALVFLLVELELELSSLYTHKLVTAQWTMGSLKKGWPRVCCSSYVNRNLITCGPEVYYTFRHSGV